MNFLIDDKTKSTVLQIGHNFGAIHDEITEHCNTPGYIMGESGTSALAQQSLESLSFSSCSERCIKQDLEVRTEILKIILTSNA